VTEAVLPNPRLKLTGSGGRLKGNESLLIAAARPQPKRNPLDDANMSVAGNLQAMPASDTVTRLALTSAVITFGAPHGQRVIVSSHDDHLTPRSLPDSLALTFVLLRWVEVQRFADQQGDISYLEVHPSFSPVTLLGCRSLSRPRLVVLNMEVR
jgi:hypothetical protein